MIIAVNNCEQMCLVVFKRIKYVVRQIEDTNCDLFLERVSSLRLVLNVTLPRGDKTFLLFLFTLVNKNAFSLSGLKFHISMKKCIN